MGLLTLVLFAFLAAVYLTVEARDPALREDFRRRALVAAGAVFLAAFGTLGLALARRAADGPRAHHRAGAPALHVATGVAAVTAIGRSGAGASGSPASPRPRQVTLILWGWALAQYPYLIPPI